MSPRRKLTPGGEPRYPAPPPPPRRWGLPVVAILTTATAAAAITVCALDLYSHETQRQATIRDAAALTYVRSFMTEFTSPDPFHANGYTDRILAQATGDFAQQYRQNRNEILLQVARVEPTTGSVLDAGVSRQNDDGSIDVLVTTKFTAKSPDGKLQVERTNRWVVTAKQEGERWKIARLNPMI
ncbi:MAG: mammalian cell entry protein [Mycobacterium sp.]|uniref:mammalian cell entry protein n=1 Tax=Mycobacterium sp. TaxID=1785 RepID=UPI0026270364|nr:mammalian cell entry protein [Mycobacterium sp.]MDI3313110.1 mammalian cell entry protein [Mycobacterium sp.]